MSVTSNRYVVLLRVSTQRQGADGHGIAGQRRDIESYLRQQPDAQVLTELVEVGSGGKELCDRPVLQEAMALCRVHNCTLLVSALSRLTRDAAICLNLMKDSTVQFKVAAMPSAGNLQLGIYAVLNEEERRQCSIRTRAALAAARERGVKLGNPQNLWQYQQHRQQRCRKVQDQNSGLVLTLRKSGKTLREICQVLNDAGITTGNGGMFYPTQVSRILKRCEVAA